MFYQKKEKIYFQKKMVRLIEIAQKTGCSIGTISQVLNPGSKSTIRVSEKTKKHVIEVAQQMGYRPNRGAQFLKRGHIPEIGIFLPSFNNDLVLNLIKGCSNAANEAGFALSYFFDLSQKCFASFLEEATKKRNCGLVTYPRFELDKKTAQLLWNYKKSGGKVVFIESSGPEIPPLLPELDRVFIDDRKGGKIVAEHLLEMQCTNFTVVGKFRPRVESFIKTVEAAGYQCKHFEENDNINDILTSTSSDKRGIFCTLDTTAGKIHTSLLLKGEIPGKNTLLCGYDCLNAMQELTPSLTSVRQPFFEAGNAAVKMLIDLIYGKKVKDALFEPQLIKRETTLGIK